MENIAKSSVGLFSFVLDSYLFDFIRGEPDNFDEFWICGTPGNPYLWIEYTSLF